MRKLNLTPLAVALLVAPATLAQNTFPSSGSVGIGTTSPIVSLQVVGDVAMGRSDGSTWYFQSPSSDLRIVGAASGANLDLIPNGGYVGIGTTSPLHPLDVAGSGNFSSSLSVGYYQIYMNAFVPTPQSTSITENPSNPAMFAIDSFGADPTHLPEVKVTGRSSNDSLRSTYLDLTPTSATFSNPVTAPGVTLPAGSGASMTFADGTTQSTAWTGTTCGGDYAESVDVAGDRTRYEPGDVLVIDPEDEGKFLKSVQPYSTFVTGIYSTKPGLVGRRQLTDKSHMKDEVPMAMTGIVPTKVTAENGPIQPGDLLVTSSRLGYAMKGTDRSRMLGAVIGKALGHLDSGTGVIEVVVTLQ